MKVVQKSKRQVGQVVKKKTATDLLLEKMLRMGKINPRVARRLLGDTDDDGNDVVSTQLECCGMMEVQLMGSCVESVHGYIYSEAAQQKVSLFLMSLTKENTPSEREIPGLLGAKPGGHFTNRRTGHVVELFSLKLDTTEKLLAFKQILKEEKIEGFTKEDIALIRRLPSMGSYGSHNECWNDYKPVHLRKRCSRCQILALLGKGYM